MKPRMVTRQLAGPILMMASILLASCGGGGAAGVLLGSGGVGSGGTGVVLGTVIGLGSIIVDGTTYNSATPVYESGTQSSESTTTTATALELGAQVNVQTDSQGNPITVAIEPELIGTVSGYDATLGTFTVNNVTVRINTNAQAGPTTFFVGLGGSSDLASATPLQVEVHGVLGIDPSGQAYIMATLIELRPATNSTLRVTGIVSNLAANAGSFDLGSEHVVVSSTTSLIPAGTPLANGQVVNVWSNLPASGNTITANVIRQRSLVGIAGPVQLSGLVANLTGTSFTVSGISIDASASALASTVSTLSAGDYVVVTGTSAAATGSVVANNLRSFSAQPIPLELHGTIISYTGIGNFLVRGVPVNGTNAQFNAGASASSLATGVYVSLTGTLNGNVVQATSITVTPSVPDGSTVDYQGAISQVNNTAGTFTLTTANGTIYQASLAANAAYSDGSAANLVNGANVEVEASSTATGLSVYSVSFRSIPASSSAGSGTGSGSGSGSSSATTTDTSGVVYNVTATDFSVNGILIQINGVAVSPQGTTLANGLSIEVTFTQSGGLNLAQEISIDN